MILHPYYLDLRVPGLGVRAVLGCPPRAVATRPAPAGHAGHGGPLLVTCPCMGEHCHVSPNTALVPTMSAPAALPPARPPVGAEVAAEPAQAVGKQGLGFGSAFSSISGNALCSSLIELTKKFRVFCHFILNFELN